MGSLEENCAAIHRYSQAGFTDGIMDGRNANYLANLKDLHSKSNNLPT